MCNSRVPVTLMLSFGLATSVALGAGPRAPEKGRTAPPGIAGLADHVPAIDGPVATTVAPDGRIWAVWSYRASGEFDVAVASKDPAGAWSSPTFFGRRDGVDQLDPALAVDAAGNLYLAYTTKAPQAVLLAVRPAGTMEWSQGSRLAAEPGVSDTAVRIVGDRVVVAYRTARGVEVTDVPVVPPAFVPSGIQDGPDGVDPLGVTGGAPAGGGSGSGSGSGSGGNGGNGGGNGGGNSSGSGSGQ
jgi:uncharacterized membrane protein YgcG